MCEPTRRPAELDRENPVNEARAKVYERLMDAEEQIAQARYAHGVADELVLAAMDAGEAVPSEAERREDLYLSSLSAYVRSLGGYLEIRAVFPDQTVVVQPSPMR